MRLPKIESGWFLGVVGACALAFPLALSQALVLIAVTGAWAMWHGRTMRRVDELNIHVTSVWSSQAARIEALEELTKDYAKVKADLSAVKSRGVIR